jgi:tetratricopeptide (TPR) repeat protein
VIINFAFKVSPLYRAKDIKIGYYNRNCSVLQKNCDQHFPNSEILLVRLGHTYLALERLEEAFTAMDLVLKINPQNFDALQVLKLVLDRQGKKEEAQVTLLDRRFLCRS